MHISLIKDKMDYSIAKRGKYLLTYLALVQKPKLSTMWNLQNQ